MICSPHLFSDRTTKHEDIKNPTLVTDLRRGTHVLLTAACLVRRSAGVEVIGEVLERAAAGWGYRPIAARVGRPAETVRGWLRAARGNAGIAGMVLARLLVELDRLVPPWGPGGSLVGDLVELVGVVGAAARRRFGVGAGSPWQVASAATGGLLLAGGLRAV
jgi:hypothetical protein